MTYFVEDTGKGQKVYRTHVIEPRRLNVFNSDLSLKILERLAGKPQCAMDIARGLKQHEQKIYYHLRRMQEVGIVKLDRTEPRIGALAKIYSVASPYLTVKLFEGEHLMDLKTKVRELEFFKSFVSNGKLDATIVVGSPDMHGKYGVQASDGSVAIDLALMLGTFVTSVSPNYKLDTELRDKDLKGNLILVGGPKANIMIDKLNKKLPVYFDTDKEFDIISTMSKSVYSGEDTGIIVKMKNPYNKEKEILILSGKRFKGTKAAIVALLRRMKNVIEDNKAEGAVARIVRGMDRNADGIIDDVEFLE